MISRRVPPLMFVFRPTVAAVASNFRSADVSNPSSHGREHICIIDGAKQRFLKSERAVPTRALGEC